VYVDSLHYNYSSGVALLALGVNWAPTENITIVADVSSLLSLFAEIDSRSYTVTPGSLADFSLDKPLDWLSPLRFALTVTAKF
jgi:hypothetical protein